MCPCGMYTVHAGVYIMYMQVDTACIGNVGVEFVRIAYISINQSINQFISTVSKSQSISNQRQCKLEMKK